MRIPQMGLVLGLLLAARAGATDAPPAAPQTPQRYNTACALATSMAGKLGANGRVTHEAAQQSCAALAPTMSPSDHAEFMRCCMQTLEAGAPAGKAPQQTQPAPNPAQKM